MKKILLFCFMTGILFSCEVKVNTGTDDKKTATTGGNDKIRNGIVLHTKDLEVEQVFLLYPDGSLVPEDNKTKVNEDIKMRLIISGWKEENGMVYPGAAEKIETNKNLVLVDEPDLFAAYTGTGVKADDAKYISLTATITKVEILVDYFLVTFRVWDKKGTGEITGSYKLYL